MGSFLVDCFVSKQIVNENAKAVIFPISKHAGYNLCKLSKGNMNTAARNEFDTTCYSSAFWNLRGVKIDVIADDYGKQNLVDTDFNRKSLMVFFKDLIENAYVTALGENECHDLAFDFSTMLKEKGPTILTNIQKNENTPVPFKELEDVWSDLQEAVSENRVFVDSCYPSGVPVQLQFAVCLSEAYDYLVNEAKTSRMQKDFNKNVSKLDEVLD
jgi:hypothetical protein